MFNCEISPIINILLLLIFTIIYYTNKKLSLYFQATIDITLLTDIQESVQHNDRQVFNEKCKTLLKHYPSLINFPIGRIRNSPFLFSCMMGDSDTMEMMLENGADLSCVNYHGNGPFYLATYYLVMNPEIKDASSIRRLYYAGCSINAKNNEGFTPLHLAAYFGHVPLIRWLLLKGADKIIEPLPAGLALANGHELAASLLLNNITKNV